MNARQAQLQSQRSTYGSYGSATKIRILAPAQTGISSIAKQNAANETDIMIAKYNNGQVDNATMKSFLQTQMASPYTSASDRVQIQTKLQDFDVLIEKDRLESVFKSAQENTIAKEQAAQALAQFYTNRASTMQAGTPAHSQALENAGVWQQNVQSIQASVGKEQQKNYKNQMLAKVNSIPDGSGKAQASAEMYKRLRDMAAQQGDVESAQVYEANRQNELQNEIVYKQQENAKQTTQQMKQFIADKQLEVAQLTDKSPEELKRKMEINQEIADKYGELGDQYNATRYLTIATQAEEKYQKKMGDASAAEAGKMAYQSEKDYSDNIRLAQERYVNGMYDDKQFKSAEEEYKDSLSRSVSEWKDNIENIRNKVLDMNIGDKIYWRGKNRSVTDALAKEIDAEYQKTFDLDNAVRAGTVMLKEVPAGEKITGKPDYELIDVTKLSEQEQQLLRPDEQGILHSGEMGKQEIDKETFNSLMQEDNYRKDLDYNSKTGKYYQDSGLQFSVRDPQTGQVIVQREGPDGRIQSASDLRQGARNLGKADNELINYDPEAAQSLQLAKESGEIRAEGKTKEEVQKKMRDQIKAEQSQMAVEKEAERTPGLVEKIASATNTILPRGKTVSPIPEKRTLGQQLTDTVGKSPFAAVSEIVQNIKNPPKQSMAPTVKEPVNIQQAVQSGGLTINKPAPQPTQGLTYNTPAPAKPVTFTPAQPVDIQKAVQSGGLSTPIKVPAPQPTTLQKIATTIKTTSPFSWLKSKLGY